MKIINKITLFSLLSLLMIILLLPSCSENPEQPVIKSDLKIDSSKINLRMEENGSFSVKVTAGREFECALVSNNGNWVIPQKPIDTIYPKGKDIEFKFNYDKNFTGEDRTALILFKNSDMNQYTDTVYISQSKTLYIDVKTPGKLWEEIRNKGINDSLQIKSLSLTGKLNGADVLCLRQMSGCGKTIDEATDGKLANLDISKIIFVKDNTIYFHETDDYMITDINALPASIFISCQSLKTINLPISITKIEQSAFVNCNGLVGVNIPNGVTSIGIYVFQDCTSLASINIPNGVEAISDYIFTSCTSLKNVTIPNSVKSIGLQSFVDCESLRSIHLPKNITSIGDDAFNYGTALTSVTIDVINPSSVKYFPNNVFPENNNITLYVPRNSINDYTTNTNWNKRFKYIQPQP